MSLAIFFVIISQVDLNLNQKMIQSLEIKEGLFVVAKPFPDGEEFLKSRQFITKLTLGFKLKILARLSWQCELQYFFSTKDKVLRVARLTSQKISEMVSS